MPVHPLHGESRNARKTTRTRRNISLFDSIGQGIQVLESRALMAVFSANGGLGGTSGPLALDPGLNLVKFRWENYSIQDEFQILHNGKRIAGNVGLQPNGENGTKVVTARNSNDEITVKVTAPLQGTAWNFTVETLPFELNVDGFLGDVVKVDIVDMLTKAGVSLKEADFKADGFGLKDLTNDRGKVAEIDNMQDELKKGVFYFLPQVMGESLDYGADRNDQGLGESKLIVTNNGQEFPIKIRVSDGHSSTGENIVTFGDKKLDIYRQEQRLTYLGFPGGASGNPLRADGISSAETTWAKNVFNIAIDPSTSGRGSLLNPGSIKKQLFKEHINDPQLPFWRNLDGTLLPPMQFVITSRKYGTDASGRFIEKALSSLLSLGLLPDSTGIAFKGGTGEPSKAHDGGRSVDIEDTPGDFYNTINGYVAANAAQGGGFIVKKADGLYRGGGNPDTKNGEIGIKDSAFKAGGAKLAKELQSYLDYKLDEGHVRLILDAFINAGSPLVFYNDPRFFDIVNGVRFWEDHYHHIHFSIPSPLSISRAFSLNAPMAESRSNVAMSSVSPLTAKPPGRLSNAIDLGSLSSQLLISGNLTADQPDRIYRFEIGSMPQDLEGGYYDTPRDFAALLENLSSDADLEIIADPNYDGVGEVVFSSANGGTVAESIAASQLGSGVYYARVIRKDTDTSFNLSLSVAPRPIPVDNAGGTAVTAADLGILTGPVTRNDFIGEVDTQDLYKFQIDSISDLSLNVSGLDTADATLAVGLDNNGNGLLDIDEYLSFSDADNNGDESLQYVRLPAGNYLVHVGRNSGNSNYQLTASATKSIIPMDQAGDTIAGSFDLGTLSAPVKTQDFIGVLDRVDTYRFKLYSQQGVRVSLSGLTSDADLEIYRDVNNNGRLDMNERIGGSYLGGTSFDEIALNGLAAGEYFIRVIQSESDTEYTLNATSETATGSNLAVTRDYPSVVPDLGTQFTYRVTVKNNGPDIANDVILNEAAPVGLHLVQVTASSPSSSAQFYGNQVTGNIPSLLPGESVSFDITAFSYIAGDLIGTTNVFASTQDFDTSDNTIVTTGAINSIVSPPADLELTQTVSNATPKVGDQITLSISLTNNGPGTATVIRVKDLLPAGLGFLSSSSDIGTYDHNTGLWVVGNLPPATTVRLSIVGEVLKAVSMTNIAEVVAMDESDPDSSPNNNLATEDDQSAQTIIPVGTPIAAPLKVTKIERFGIRYQPTKLVVSFNTELDSASAQNRSNYRLQGPGGRRIPVLTAKYQPLTNSVTLSPLFRLHLFKRYTLIINGSQPNGIHTAQGSFLNQGTNHVASIDIKNLSHSKVKKAASVHKAVLNSVKLKSIPSDNIIRSPR